MLEIPYIKQINPNACGAATLEMVYKFYGLDNISQAELMQKYQELEPHGSTNYRMSTQALVTDARKKGFESVYLQANYFNKQDCLSSLKILVETNKIPVIVCQKFTDQMPLIGHFRIVIGVDNDSIYLHDPNIEIGGEKLKWTLDKFIDFWQPTGQNVTGGILCLITRSEEY